MRPRSPLSTAAAVAAVAALTAAALSAPALAARSTYQAAPAYPNTRLAIAVKGKPRAGAITTVVVSGWNERREISQGSGSFLDYSLELFVQDRRVLPSCPAAYGRELDNVINLGNRISQIARGVNLGEGGRFRVPVKYQSGSTRKVVFCAYTRVIIDDAAVSALRYEFAPPRARARRRR